MATFASHDYLARRGGLTAPRSLLGHEYICYDWLFYSTNKTSGDGTHTTTIGSVLGSGASVPVSYGPSSDQEMCYNFTISYPLGALNNGAFGLNGALNNCW